MINTSTEKPLFSIITVCYNSENTVEHTIRSVLSQNFDNVEYIIVDGGSIDGTLKIIEKFRDNIDQVIAEPDQGPFDAMNKGIRASKGSLIGILNSDDWYEPDTLEIVAEAYNKSEGRTVFHGLCKYIDAGKEGRIISYHHDDLPQRSIAHPTCFIPAVIYEEFGLYDTSYKIASDYELLLRLYEKGISFQRIERVLANFRSGGITSQQDSKYEDLAIHLKYGKVDPVKYRLKKLKFKLSDLLWS